MTGGKNDIAIVGMSCHFPGANNIREFWNNLCNGVSSITDTPDDRIPPSFFANGGKTEIDRFYCRKGGFINPITFNPIEYGILPIAAEGIDPEHLASLYLVKEALTDAGVYEKNIPLQDCAFILGKGNYIGVASQRVGEMILVGDWLQKLLKNLHPEMGDDEIDRLKKDFQSQVGRFQADTAAGAMPNMIVSLTANKFNLRGPAYTIDAACASSMLAVEQACSLLLSSSCDIALAGGMHLGQGASFWSVFNVIGAMSYKGKISPFSEDADGVLVGEGAGIVVLKKLDKAIADNDRIYAVIKACGSGSDGSDVSVMAPSSKGQVETLEKTWRKTQMDATKIGYVETHGTATQVGDRTEIATLTDFFGDNTAPSALLGSVKSNIGHTMPAAGIAGLIKTALALYHKKIPPTLNCEKPLKAMHSSRFIPVQQLTDWDEEKYPLVAAINAFGFGGINTHAILTPYAVETNQAMVSPASSAEKSKMSITLDFTHKTFNYSPLKSAIDKNKNGSVPIAPAFIDDEVDDVILQEANNNLRAIAALQENMMNWYKTKSTKRIIKDTSNKKQSKAGSTHSQKTGDTIEKMLYFNLDEHPYLIDHSVVRQSADRPMEEMNPVVPFSMTLETLCEEVVELAPDKKLLQVNNAGVMKWISVREPFVEKLTGVWKTDDTIAWNLPGFAFGDFTVGNAFPAVPEEYARQIDLGDSIAPSVPNKERIYQFFLFHGPKYHSIIEVKKLTKTGLQATIRKSEGKGSLTDNFGGLLGMWCYFGLKEHQTTFPMSVDEITFYQDFRDQAGVFEYNLMITDIKPQELIGNIIIKRDGKVWCVVKGFHNRRLEYPRSMMNVVMRPKQFILAEQLSDNIFRYYKDPKLNISAYDFLYERYLNTKERKHFNSLYPNQARDYLISQIALKDGVRKFLQKSEEDEMIYPIEVSVEHDEQGKHFVSGHSKVKGVKVSISQNGSETTVIVSNGALIGVNRVDLAIEKIGKIPPPLSRRKNRYLARKRAFSAELN
ncbi:MAG: polyketide synthase [Dysgonamonadaceae bacterium]|jgi:3-oxoacyl-(acyl-carrier-protein) synthase|nr:polyketide synthase [Dysgonamonadaceae bacterium]